MAFVDDDEQELTGEPDGDGMKIGGKKSKKVSATGKPSAMKKAKAHKKSNKKVSKK